jgi:hypothetical protein
VDGLHASPLVQRALARPLHHIVQGCQGRAARRCTIKQIIAAHEERRREEDKQHAFWCGTLGSKQSRGPSEEKQGERRAQQPP